MVAGVFSCLDENFFLGHFWGVPANFLGPPFPKGFFRIFLKKGGYKKFGPFFIFPWLFPPFLRTGVYCLITRPLQQVGVYLKFGAPGKIPWIIRNYLMPCSSKTRQILLGPIKSIIIHKRKKNVGQVF